MSALSCDCSHCVSRRCSTAQSDVTAATVPFVSPADTVLLNRVSPRADVRSKHTLAAMRAVLAGRPTDRDSLRSYSPARIEGVPNRPDAEPFKGMPRSSGCCTGLKRSLPCSSTTVQRNLLFNSRYSTSKRLHTAKIYICTVETFLHLFTRTVKFLF